MRDEMLACEHEFAPKVDQLTTDSPVPLLAGPDGKYPVPKPGIKTKRQFSPERPELDAKRPISSCPLIRRS